MASIQLLLSRKCAVKYSLIKAIEKINVIKELQNKGGKGGRTTEET